MRRYGDDFTHGGEWRCGCGCINAEDAARCWHCDADTDGEMPDCDEGEGVLSSDSGACVRRLKRQTVIYGPKIRGFESTHAHHLERGTNIAPPLKRHLAWNATSAANSPTGRHDPDDFF